MVRLATPEKTQRVVVVPQHFDDVFLDRSAFVDGITWALWSSVLTTDLLCCEGW